MRKAYVIVFIFISNVLFSQKIVLKILNNENNSLDSVKIYNKSGDLVASTREGLASFTLLNKDSISFAKEGYKDITLSSSELFNKTIIKLNKNQNINLKEVIITGHTPVSMLKMVIESEKLGPRCKTNVSYYNFYYDFYNDKNLIQKFEGRVSERNYSYKSENNAIFINNMTNTVVNNFKGKKKVLLQRTNYSNFTSHQIYPTLFTTFVKDNRIENYNIEITGSSENLIKLKFSPKINDEWKYEGFIIFDKISFKVLELSRNLIISNKNIIDDFLFTKSSIFVKKFLLQDDCYKLERATSSEEFSIYKGKDKGVKFKARSFQEQTVPFNDKKLSEIDFMNFKKK